MDSIEITLDQLPLGGSFTITHVDPSLSASKRLEELGFISGSIADKLYAGLGGSPIAVRVSGAVICVRSSDAKLIYGKIGGNI